MLLPPLRRFQRGEDLAGKFAGVIDRLVEIADLAGAKHRKVGR